MYNSHPVDEVFLQHTSVVDEWGQPVRLIDDPVGTERGRERERDKECCKYYHVKRSKNSLAISQKYK